MLVNYHTHTRRCNHATGSERDYIEQALSAGIRVLGFSDHTPCPFPDGHNSWFRMSVESCPEYFDTIRALRDEYAGRIELHVGVELEYYPAIFPAQLELLRRNGCEYLLLGQHYLYNEEDDRYCGNPTDEPARLVQYVDQTIEAMETGYFTYLAHPDLLNFTGDRGLYRLHMERLCRAAKELDMPLELNLLGLHDGRSYPDRDFWRLAAETGTRVVLGCDAHRPEAMNRPETEAAGRRLLAELGITPEESVPLVPLI
jgi:histidinol-phosphatase (PHP family)